MTSANEIVLDEKDFIEFFLKAQSSLVSICC